MAFGFLKETTTAKLGVIGEKLKKPPIPSSLPSGLGKFNAIDADHGHSVNDLPMAEELEEMVRFLFSSCFKEFVLILSRFSVCLHRWNAILSAFLGGL